MAEYRYTLSHPGRRTNEESESWAKSWILNRKMMFRVYRLQAYFFLIFVLFCEGITAQKTSQPPRLDHSIRHGKLSNGLTYYIKSVDNTSSNIHLELLVINHIDVKDSLNLDFPHTLEHLAFKKSKSFPMGLPNQIEMLEDVGMENVGRGFNASSSNRFTVYTFDSPAGRMDAFNLGLVWFKDIANQDLKLFDKDIDAVRGELRQEMLLRNGNELNANSAESKLASKLYPCRKDKSRYFEYVNHFSSDSLREFYEYMYRPEQMAISATGNIEDIDEIEKRIREEFSDIKPPRNTLRESKCNVIYFRQPPQFVKVSQPLDTMNPITNDKVKTKLVFRDSVTNHQLSDYKGLERLVLWDLISEVLYQRFSWEEEGYECNFTLKGSYSYKFDISPPVFTIDITSTQNQEIKALKTALQVFSQFYRHGVSNEVWNNVKERYLSSLNSNQEKNASYWLKGITEHFLYGKAFPTEKQQYLYQWLQNISAKDFNKRLQEMLSKVPQDIGIIAPENHQILSVTERDIRSLIEEILNEPTQPYQPPSIPLILMDEETKASLQEVNYRSLEEGMNGEKIVVFKNGVKVILKPFKPTGEIDNDKILIHGFSPYGAFCFPKENYFSAVNAAQIVLNAGIADYDKFELERFLSTTHLQSWNVRPYINNEETGIKAKAIPQDMEPLFQLIYLYFTQPRKDELAFKNWKRTQYENYLRPIINLDGADIRTSIGNITKDISSIPIGTERFEGVNRTSYNQAYKVYQKLFGYSEGFTFIISGDFQLNDLEPFVQKYLGNLPDRTKKLSCIKRKEKHTSLMPGPVYTEIAVPKNYDLQNVNYRLQYIKKVVDPLNWKERLKVEALGAITYERAWRIRYEEGLALYYLDVRGKLNKAMARYEIKFRFECDPDEFELIKNECQQIIQELKSGELKKEFFTLGLKRMKKEYSLRSQNQHQEVQGRLYNFFRYDEDLIDPEEVEHFVNSLTEEDIIETANKYFRDDYKYEFIMSSSSK